VLRLRGVRGGAVMQQIGRLFLEGTSIGLSEGELLDRFVRARDESAFEVLVARHGPMVLSVCRSLLRDPNDVDDAFQATFLVLVRKASTLRQCDLLANWLYGVAIRVAMRARGQAARRMGRFGAQGSIEKLVAAEDLGRLETNAAALLEPEPAPWLHQEVSHLPEKYRTPIVLCYFEGLTHDEAANRMGCPLGTVKGRLARARDLLRRRLTRRGFALSAAMLASQLAAPHAQAAVPAALEMSTARAALSLVSSASASFAWGSSISIPVTALAEGVLHTMAWNQVRITAGALLFAGTLATGVVIGATQVGGGSGAESTVQVNRQSAKGGSARPSSAPTAGAGLAKRPTSMSPDEKSQAANANRTFELMLSHLEPPIDELIERLSKWSSLMLSAELVVAANEDEEHTARTAHRDRMKRLHEAIKSLPPSAQNQTVNAELAREKLDEAENLLASAPSGPARGMGMMQQMQQQMQMMQSMQQRRRRGGMMGGGMMGGGMMGMAPAGRRGVDKRGPAMGAGGGGSAGGQASEIEAGRAAGAMAAQPAAAGQPAAMAGGMMAPLDGRGGPGGARGNGLSLAIVSAATEFAICDKNPKSKQIHKKLDEPVSMSFNAETPLEDVLNYIKQATTTKTYGGIPIYVDPQGLAEADANMAGTVRLDLEGVPLKTTLRLLLKQLGLAYCVHDGLLFISSPHRVFEELRDAKQELDTANLFEEEAAKDARQQ
jgi:RNA polymerase sigma factor (sigma-70 family)